MYSLHSTETPVRDVFVTYHEYKDQKLFNIHLKKLDVDLYTWQSVAGAIQKAASKTKEVVESIRDGNFSLHFFIF